MGARSKARKRAVDILFEADLRGEDPVTLIAGRIGSADVPPVNDYTVTLVEGVKAHQARIDDLISEHAEGWTLQRMPAIDLTVLRIATFELFHRPDVPTAVVLDEAIELAKRFGSEQSGRFVNGLLDGLLRSHHFPGSMT